MECDSNTGNLQIQAADTYPQGIIKNATSIFPTAQEVYPTAPQQKR